MSIGSFDHKDSSGKTADRLHRGWVRKLVDVDDRVHIINYEGEGMQLWIVAVIAVSVAVPAHAHWQSTRWGMAPAQVVAASGSSGL